MRERAPFPHPHSLSRREREASRGALRAHPIRSGGFTLIEVVVVLVIITIILGMVGVNLTRNPSDILRDEAQRLALVLQNAQQEAILEGRPYGFMFTAGGYRFLRLDDKGRLVPIKTDQLLSPRALPPAISLASIGSADNQTKSADDMKSAEPIIFDPSGEFPAFTLSLSIGDISWYVRGQSDGQVLSSPLPEPASA